MTDSYKLPTFLDAYIKPKRRNTMKRLFLAAAFAFAVAGGMDAVAQAYDCSKDAQRFSGMNSIDGGPQRRQKVYVACEAVNACAAACPNQDKYQKKACMMNCMYE
jgi:hypothetical protein